MSPSSWVRPAPPLGVTLRVDAKRGKSAAKPDRLLKERQVPAEQGQRRRLCHHRLPLPWSRAEAGRSTTISAPSAAGKLLLGAGGRGFCGGSLVTTGQPRVSVTSARRVWEVLKGVVGVVKGRRRWSASPAPATVRMTPVHASPGAQRHRGKPGSIKESLPAPRRK